MASKTLPLKGFKDTDHLGSTPESVPSKRLFKNLTKPRMNIIVPQTKFQLQKRRHTRIWIIKGTYTNPQVFRNTKKALNSDKNIQEVSFWQGCSHQADILSRCYFNAIAQVTSLQYIHFDFSCCFDKSLDKLKRCLQRLKLLKEFDLSSYNCRQLTDLGLQSLSQGLKSCLLLQKVIIRSKWCSKFTDTGLIHLSKALKRLISLKTAKFYFYGCPSITDIGFQELTRSLKGLVSLEDLGLQFGSCDYITDKGISDLCEMTKNLPCLKEISLDFSAKNITSEWRQKIWEVQEKYSPFSKRFQRLLD